MGIASEARYVFELSGREILVVGFEASEGISMPYRVELELASEEEVSFDDVIGREGFLRILGEDSDRYFHGIIARFVQTGGSGRFFRYQALLVPSIWLLGFEKDCRIFQNKTVQQIVSQVLQDRGIPGDRYEFRLQGEYQPREYCVQYRETDLDFISRLLECEGIFYFFEHSEEGHVLVFGDTTVNYQPIEGDSEVPYRSVEEMVEEEEFVRSFVLSRQIRSGKVSLRDFNFQRPSMDLTVQEQAESFRDLEVYDYPGGYTEGERGRRLAQLRLQESMSFMDQAEGEGVCVRFTSGFTFRLTDHEQDEFNQEYLIVNIFHKGSQPQVLEERASGGLGYSYYNSFSCIPSSVTFRPQARTPKPVVRGIQTALVVGPEGEEIYTDRYGRVKVQFHWDREGGLDEQSSCWVRVSQNWAGGGYGYFCLPRVGQEVIVDFLEGDPDRPVITGRLYNADHLPPYTLPEKKTISTIKSKTYKGEGANEIRFEDQSGKEQLFIHAQKDLDIRVLGDHKVTVDNEHHLLVKKASKVKLGSLSLTVGGDQAMKVGGQRSVTVEKDVLESFKQNHKQEVGNEQYLKAQKVIIEAGLEITIKAAGGFIKIDPAGVTIQGNLVMINSGGAPGVPSIVATPALPASPVETETTRSGSDTTYSPRSRRPTPSPQPAQLSEPVTISPEEEQEEHEVAPSITRARWERTPVKCGDKVKMLANTKDIPAGSNATFTIKRVSDNRTITSISARTKPTSVEATWISQKPTNNWNGPDAEFKVHAAGVSVDSQTPHLEFYRYPDIAPVDFNRQMHDVRNMYGWQRRVKVELKDRVLLIHVPIKVIKRRGNIPKRRKHESWSHYVRRCDRAPLAGNGNLSTAEKAAFKMRIEQVFRRKMALHREHCQRHSRCPDPVSRKCCKIEIKVLVHFYDRGDPVHASVVNYWNGSGRANSGNWFSADFPSRAWVFAHEVGHLIGFYDEYPPDGAWGPSPPWQHNNPGALMYAGTRLETYYFDEYARWLGSSSRTNEPWAVVRYS